MVRFMDIRPILRKFVLDGCETAECVMRVSKTPEEGIYAYEELRPLVRCKDCAKWATENRFTGGCIGPNGDADPDGFCAWGERKVVEE